MNYYERVQKSIDYIESNLENKIDINIAAQTAFMSLSNFYRMFFALTGYQVKEYIRQRRLSFGAIELKSNNTCIIDIAVKFNFESGDSFSRAFKRLTGFLPSEYRKQNKTFLFERIEIMNKYFDEQDRELLERYPDIKVLKTVEPMKVAYYRYYGKNPEYNAFKVLLEWAGKNKLTAGDSKYRLFGYDTPDCEPNLDEYGYEACITIDGNCNVEDDMIKIKELQGGLYAVTTVGVKDIGRAWQRFKTWVKISKYDFGTHQWLEEHLEGINESSDYNVDLYMPICEKSKFSIETLNDTNVVICKIIGEEEKAPYEAWDILLSWAKANGILNTSEKHRFFAHHNYNVRREGIKRWYIAMVTVDDEITIDDKRIKKDTLNGGNFVTCNTNFTKLPEAWEGAINWIGLNGLKINPKIKWLEEWYVQDSILSPVECPSIKIYVPIKE